MFSDIVDKFSALMYAADMECELIKSTLLFIENSSCNHGNHNNRIASTWVLSFPNHVLTTKPQVDGVIQTLMCDAKPKYYRYLMVAVYDIIFAIHCY